MANGFNPLANLAQGISVGEHIAQAPQRAQQNALALQGQQQKLQQAKTTAGQQQTQFDQGQAKQRAQILNQTARAFKNLDPSQWPAALESVKPKLAQFGIDASQFNANTITPESLDEAITVTQGFMNDPDSIKTAAERAFEQKTKGLTPEQVHQARLIDAGIAPRATTGAAKTVDIGGVPHIFDPATKTMIRVNVGGQDVTTKTVAESEGTIAGAKEGSKLAQQLKLKPEIQASIERAIANVRIEIDAFKTQKSNAQSLKVYETGMTGLINALGGTTTGPFVGFTPAITGNQQIADGAVAAMAPILKQLFRGAGEGTFTDNDQKLLLDMVPTRKDRPAARVSKLQNIDAIVRAKLSQPDKVEGKGEGKIMIDDQGNRARVFEDGTFEELP